LVIDAANVMDVADSSPGKVVVSNGQQLVVATGNQGLSIAAIAPAGKRHMSVAEFLRGYRVQVGDRFGPNS
jgi:methionyl-tRNA formyltransferase